MKKKEGKNKDFRQKAITKILVLYYDSKRYFKKKGLKNRIICVILKRLNKNIFKGEVVMKKIVLLGCLGLSSIVYAGEGRISADIQTMNGKAGEYVYADNGDKVSYLDWKIRNVPILKLGYDYTYNNWEFSVAGKKNIGKNYRSGYMKDYDWFSTPEGEDKVLYVSGKTKEEAEKIAERKKGLEVKKDEEEDDTYSVYYTPQEEDRGSLSNFSKNKNYVKNIVGIDLSVKYYVKKSEKFTFAPLVGLNYDKYEFYSLSGDQLNYIPGVGAGVFLGENIKSITYKQRFMTPYIGFKMTYIPNVNWDITWGLNGSLWGRARAIDRHLERGSMETVERFKNMKYLSSDLTVKYHWNEAFSLKAGVEIVKHFKNTKPTVRVTPEEVTKDDPVTTEKNIGGAKNYNVSYSLGFEYKF